MSQLTALLALLVLDDLPRTGWILRGVPRPESVAGHVLGTAFVALALGPRVEPPLDMRGVLTMALVHDVPEAATGDLPRRAGAWLPGGAKREMEAAAAREVLEHLSLDAHAAFESYAASATREARFVRLCDKLQLGVRLLGYQRAGQRGLEEFAANLRRLDCREFQVADELRREILAAL